MDDDLRWTSTVVLGDGSTAVIRPIVPADGPALAEFHRRQSAESRYLRYFTPKAELSDVEIRRFTTVDFVDRVAFVIEEHGQFVGWASYERWSNRDDAEVAFQVDDHHQGKGIATLLLEHLASVARWNGITRFTAQTLGDNRSMLAVFTKAGWPVHRRFESGVIDIEFPLADTAQFIDSVERREQRADSQAVARILLAPSIAVVGATDRPHSIGDALWRHLSRDTGRRVHAVNPNRSSVRGAVCVPRLADIDDDVGLALIAVPVAQLEGVIDDCIAKRVRGAVVVTAIEPRNPSEPKGGAANGDAIDIDRLVSHARRNGLRIIGPSSVGIASPRPDVAIHATVADLDLPPGNVAFSMQSGTLGSAVLRLAAELQIPVSWFVSLGDKVDVSGNDLLQFWEDDIATRVIALYTETLGNPRKFARIARRVSMTRPIVAVRTGDAAEGAGAEALYANTGMIVVPTVTSLLDTVRVLATQPLPAGWRVAVVSNSASPRVLATASLTAAGLEVVEATQLSWRSSADDYRAALIAARDSPDIDAVLVIHAPPLLEAVGEPIDAIETGWAGATKPLVAVMLGAGNGPLREGSTIPSFAFPEHAATVLGRIAQYAEWRRSEAARGNDFVTDHIDVAGAGAIIAEALADTGDGLDRDTLDRDTLHRGDPRLLDPVAARALLSCYGVEMADGVLVAAAEAAEAAARIGFPVAVKAEHRGVGRSAEAGVALDVGDVDEVRRVVALMGERLDAGARRLHIQRMAAPGVDVRVRAEIDDRIGTVLSVGLGGLQADAIGDAARRLAPVSVATAAAMVGDTRAASALDPAGIDRLAGVVARVGQLVSDHPEISALDLNPVIVSTGACTVSDATIQLSRRRDPSQPVRRLEQAP